MTHIAQRICDICTSFGVFGITYESFVIPKITGQGDISLPCFELAKKEGKNPVEVAKDIAQKFEIFALRHYPDSHRGRNSKFEILDEVKAVGPYVNFYLNAAAVARMVLGEIENKQQTYGVHEVGEGKTVMVEFGCPNPMKAFHLGHLKNLITGESVARLFECSGYTVIRANYQGDVGMHIAKTMWGLADWADQFEAMKTASLKERVEFLGKAYAHGATVYEESEEKKAEVVAYNKKVYEQDPSIQEVYTTARQWSLDYFDSIYRRMNTGFDKLYFESQTFVPGKQIVLDGVEKGVFRESEGAVIFPGSEHGLHDRVFINSENLPTYEAKDLALSQIHFTDFPQLDRVVHVVGKEQSDYFKVIFKAIETLGMAGSGKENHLPGGFLQLKGTQKMSSRTGNIVTGDALIEAVYEQVTEVMRESEANDKEQVAEVVTAAALKYTMLRGGVSKDVAFDLEESVSVEGESGPYLLYVVARIRSILAKAGVVETGMPEAQDIASSEKALLLALSQFPDVTKEAGETLDPSGVAHYVFGLSQQFNTFYHECPVLQSEGAVRAFRLSLLRATETVMVSALALLGISVVDKM